MAEFRIEVDTKRMQQIIAQLPGGIDDLLAAAGEGIVGDVKMGMQQSPADGEVYTRGNVTHIASSPGNPPRPDTGELMNSITHSANGHHERIVHDQVEYGQYLELGTEFIEARPFMKPVFETWRRSGFANLVNSFPLVK